jgi:hypothetical protein
VTVFGPDISSYQHGLDLSRLADSSFVIAKASEGTYYTDADYPGWRNQAASLGKLFCWYHFLSGEDAVLQAAHTAACVGDKNLPGMLDAEPQGSFHPTLAQIVAYIQAAHSAGLNLRLLYLPKWYWEQMGSPSLAAVAALGVNLVSSAYPGGSGTAPQEYPGDTAAGWASYGDLDVLLYQFTDNAEDDAQSLDFNAYRGTVAQLAAVLYPSTPGGTTMSTIPPSISQRWPVLTADFPPNGTYTDDTAIIWADAGARAAALIAQQTLDAVNALPSKLGQPLDTAGIAAAIEAHLSSGGGATADELEAAIEAHLTATAAVTFGTKQRPCT